MQRIFTGMWLLTMLTVSACAGAAAPSSSSDQPSAQFIESTPIGAAANPYATATSEATQTPAPTSTPASTSSPRPGQTPAGGSSNVPPGVYASKIRLDPPDPKSGPDYVTFYVTFQNTTGKVQQYKWLVKLYTADESFHSFGETAALVSNIQPGTSEIASAANWRTNPLTCLPLTARVFWVNPDLGADPFEFKKPDTVTRPATNFQVCPAGVSH